MRRSWIAIGLLALLAGIATGYRLGRTDGPGKPPVPPGGAAHEPEIPAPPVEPAAARPAVPDAVDPAPPDARAKPAAKSEAEAEAERAAMRRWYAALDTPPPASAGSPSPKADASSESSPSGAAAVTTSAGTASAPDPPHPAKRPARSVVATQAQRLPSPATVANPPRQNSATVEPTPEPTPDPESDRNPPDLQYLSFDPPQVQDGGSTILSIGATDDLSGVKSVYGTLRSPSETATIPFVGQDAGGTGAFTAGLVIPHKADTGIWFIATLQIADKAGNPRNLAFTKATVPAGGTLQVVSAESDSNPPTVNGVFVEKQSVAGGENNQVVVDVVDDSSGVALVSGSFQSPSKAAQLLFHAVASADGPWTGAVVVPADADCGEWSLRFLRVADKANNATVLAGDSPQLGHVGFMVENSGGCDSDPPVLESATVAPPVVSNATAAVVVLAVTAQDDGSGVSGLNGRFEGPVASNGQVPRIYFSARADAANPGSPMISKITVPQFAAKGLWRVTFLQLIDNAHNSRNYNVGDPALANANITVE